MRTRPSCNFPARMTDSMAQAIETRTNVVYVGLEEEHGSHSAYLQGLRSQREYSSKTWLTPGCTSDIADRTQHLQASDYVLSGPSSGWQLCFSDAVRATRTPSAPILAASAL